MHGCGTDLTLTATQYSVPGTKLLASTVTDSCAVTRPGVTATAPTLAAVWPPVGRDEGWLVGWLVGLREGWLLGRMVGTRLGWPLGRAVGWRVGWALGCCDGCDVG